jgi:hypothetical protein
VKITYQLVRHSGLHDQSKLYCIDPWEDYDDYLEYKNCHGEINNQFIQSIENV